MTKFTYQIKDIRRKNKDLNKQKMMIHPLTSITAIENVLIKLSIKQKQFIYQVARLEYRIFKTLLALEKVNVLVKEEEESIQSLEATIKAAGEGKVAQKLLTWKVKAEYKLFKLNLRKSKIDVTKLILNQSKLGQLQQALASLEKDIANIEVQKKALSPLAIIEKKEVKTNNESILTFWLRSQQLIAQDPVNQSVREFLQDALKIAS